MAIEKRTGLGMGAHGLLRPTTRPESEPATNGQGADDPVEAADDQGRGGNAAEAKTPRARRKRPPVSTETKGRKLYLPDEIHDRLRLLAFQRRCNVSTVAAEILDRNLPRFTLERQG